MFRKLCGFLVIATMLSACGGNDNFIPPPPPIAPPIGGFNGGGFGGGGFVGGGNCGGVATQFPLNQGQPYYGTTNSNAGQSSISLQVGILGQPDFSSQTHLIAGSATIDLAELRSNTGTQQIPSSFCVSSQSQSGIMPGQYAPEDNSIAITMTG